MKKLFPWIDMFSYLFTSWRWRRWYWRKEREIHADDH